MGNILFLIIDMQNGFINNFTEDLVPQISAFQSRISDHVITAGTRLQIVGLNGHLCHIRRTV